MPQEQQKSKWSLSRVFGRSRNTSKRYYYLDGKKIRGPFILSSCFRLLDQGTICPSTQICLEGTKGWRRLDEYPELHAHDRRKLALTGHLRPGALTICAVVLMAVIALELGGILTIQFYDWQVRAKAEATEAVARPAFEAKQAVVAKAVEAEMTTRAPRRLAQATDDFDVADLVRIQEEASRVSAQELQHLDFAAAAAALLKMNADRAAMISSPIGGDDVGGFLSLNNAGKQMGAWLDGSDSGYGDDNYFVRASSPGSVGGVR